MYFLYSKLKNIQIIHLFCEKNSLGPCYYPWCHYQNCFLFFLLLFFCFLKFSPSSHHLPFQHPDHHFNLLLSLSSSSSLLLSVVDYNHSSKPKSLVTLSFNIIFNCPMSSVNTNCSYVKYPFILSYI